MPNNKAELDVWWSAYLAALAGGKSGRGAKAVAIEAMEFYREAQTHARAGEPTE